MLTSTRGGWRVHTMRTAGLVLLAAAALIGRRALAQAPAGGAVTRTDISGDWSSVVNEDAVHRGTATQLESGRMVSLP